MKVSVLLTHHFILSCFHFHYSLIWLVRTSSTDIDAMIGTVTAALGEVVVTKHIHIVSALRCGCVCGLC